MVEIFQRISHTTKNKVVRTSLNTSGFHDTKTFLHKILATISSCSLEISIWRPAFSSGVQAVVPCAESAPLSTPGCMLSAHTASNVWRVTTALCVHSYEAFVWFDCGNRLSSVNQLPLCFLLLLHPLVHLLTE